MYCGLEIWVALTFNNEPKLSAKILLVIIVGCHFWNNHPFFGMDLSEKIQSEEVKKKVMNTLL